MFNSPVYKRPDFNTLILLLPLFIMDKPLLMPHQF